LGKSGIDFIHSREVVGLTNYQPPVKGVCRMRRMYLTLAVALLALFLLAGCDGGADATETPAAVDATEASAESATEEMMEPTEEPMEEPTEMMEEPAAEPEEEPTEEMMEELTEEPMEEATEEPMADMTSVGLELVAEGFTSPVALTPVPDDSGRLFLADRSGQIYIISADGEVMEQSFLDIADRMVALNADYDERGLLGMVFHPDYANTGLFYVYYSAPLRADAPADWNHTSHISEFGVSADNPDTADPASERVLMQIDQPQGNHDGGSIAFGADGYLYIPLGDGGAADDNALGHVDDWYETNAGGNGQDLASNLLGSILRIDIDNQGADGQPYAIPADNPFVGVEGAEEVWALGFRNPYRMSFDMGGSNQLFVGDAGQNLWEEVSIVESGGNYGWNVMEGTHCFSTENPDQSLEECPEMDADGRPLMPPIIEYQNANVEGGLGLVVIGGNVYRGSARPEWDGMYIFGDWSTSFGEEADGTLLIATPSETEGQLWTYQELVVNGSENGRLNEYLLSFGQDNDGEIYILTTESAGPTGNSGKVYRLVTPGM
jgi:glucose/arabinose dehydrogenase